MTYIKLQTLWVKDYFSFQDSIKIDCLLVLETHPNDRQAKTDNEPFKGTISKISTKKIIWIIYYAQAFRDKMR